MSSYTGWYKDGTASVVNGSTAVTGVNTYWSTAGIHAGDMLTFDNTGLFVEIASVNSDTSITLAQPFTAGTKANVPYAIIRNFTSGSLPEVASQVVDALGKYTRYFNEDIATLNGKSAYEVALEHGYSGTEAQWLESLKAAGEWTTLNDRTNILTYNNAGAHNSIYRGENLGTAITAEQSAAIRDGTFKDIYSGDCWVFSNIPYTYLDENDEEQSSTYSGTMRVADLDYYLRAGNWDFTTHHAVVVPDTSMFEAPMNAEATTEGGYVGSKMRTVYLRQAEAIFKACFGEDHVLNFHRERLVNAVKDGKPSAGIWDYSVVELMDERMVYGSVIYDSGNTDGVNTFPDRNSVSCKQLNLFRHRPDLIGNRYKYWLRNVVSAVHFASVASSGDCSFYNASISDVGVRPAALIY